MLLRVLTNVVQEVPKCFLGNEWSLDALHFILLEMDQTEISGASQVLGTIGTFTPTDVEDWLVSSSKSVTFILW